MKFFFTLITFTICFLLHAQQTVILDYLRYGKDPNQDIGCGQYSHCYMGVNYATIYGYSHKALSNCPRWNAGYGTRIVASSNPSSTYNSAFTLQFPFKQGYKYDFTVKVRYWNPINLDIGDGADPYKKSVLQILLTNSLQNYTGTVCDYANSLVNLNSSTDPFVEFHSSEIPEGYLRTKTFTFRPNQCYSNIAIGAYPNQNIDPGYSFSSGAIDLDSFKFIESVDHEIVGPSNVCNQETYALNIGGVPFTGQVTWTTNNSNTITGQVVNSNQYQVTKNFNGNVKITATYTSPCDNYFYSLERDIISGNYAYGTTYFTSNTNVGPSSLGDNNGKLIPNNNTGTWDVFLSNTDLTNISWSNSNYPVSYYANGQHLSFSMQAPSTSWTSRTTTFALSATGACGTFTQPYNFTLVASGSGYRMMASPNPAKDELIVTLEEDFFKTKKQNTIHPVGIDLYNLNSGIVEKKWRFISGQRIFKLNLIGLKKGLYVLEVNNNGIKQSRQIIIE